LFQAVSKEEFDPAVKKEYLDSTFILKMENFP
jgi:hypothetical protein